MSFKQQVNIIRRKITRSLSRNIGRPGPGKNADPIPASNIKTILVNRPNHRLGNILLITPLLQELANNFPQCKIDLFVKGGLAPDLFQNYEQVDSIIRLPKKPFKELRKYTAVWFTIRKKKYDLVINVDPVSSSGRIATKVANGRYKFFGDENELKLQALPDAAHIAKRPVYLLRENMQLPVTTQVNAPVPSLDIKLSAAELLEGKSKVAELMPSGKKVISLFTYATGAKCYTPAWWTEFYNALQVRFPGYDFLEILPAENVSQLNFSITSFYSMDVRKIAAVIADTTIFIGADSGMMHLAVASQTPTIGLFNITNMAVYEPYNNGSLGIDSNKTGIPQMIDIIAGSLQDRNG